MRMGVLGFSNKEVAQWPQQREGILATNVESRLLFHMMVNVSIIVLTAH